MELLRGREMVLRMKEREPFFSSLIPFRFFFFPFFFTAWMEKGRGV